MKLLHSYRTLSEIPALIYSCKRLNPALLFCTAPVPAITSPLPEYSTEQTPPVRMLKVYECSKRGKVKIIKENPFRFLQYRLHFWFGKPSVKIGWRLEGNLGKQHVVCVLCSPSSQSSSFWTLETRLGKPLQPLFLSLLLNGLILKALQSLLWLWKVSEWVK